MKPLNEGHRKNRAPTRKGGGKCFCEPLRAAKGNKPIKEENNYAYVFAGTALAGFVWSKPGD